MVDFTKPASEIFNPVDGDGKARGADMGQAQVWGTEVETAINTNEDAFASTESQIAANAADIAAIELDVAAVVSDVASLDIASEAVLTDIEDLQSDVATLQLVQNSNTVYTMTYTALAALTPTAGTPGEVDVSDASTHTDPVVGGTVNNAGRYVYSTSPAGWRRVGDSLVSAVALNTSARTTDLIADGDITAIPATLRSVNSKVLAGYDFSGGPIIAHGDPMPELPLLDVVICYGQSQMAADNGGSQPAIFRIPPKPNSAFMLRSLGAASPQDVNISTGYDLTTMAPLFEAGGGNAFAGTTCQSYLTPFAVEYMDYHVRNRIARAPTLFINLAKDGTGWDGLDTGSVPFTNVTAILTALAKVYKVRIRFVFASGGTSNDTESQATSIGILNTLYDNAQTAWKTAVGQTDNFPWFFDMFAFNTYATTGAVGMQAAILQAHQTAIASTSNRQMICMGPSYAGPYADSYHQLPTTRFKFGTLFGLQVCRWLYENRRSTAFWITSAVHSGSTIVFTTNAAFDLAIDTTTIPADTAPASTSPYAGATLLNGILVTDSGGTPKIPLSMSVSGATFTVTFGSSPAAGWLWRYAQVDRRNTSVVYGPGGNGNICDADPAVSAWDGVTSLKQWLIPANGTVT